MRYRLDIAYDGTHYVGWQVQPNGLSIQELIQDALLLITKESISCAGSGRTDAGVHARGQVAHFDTTYLLDTKTTIKSLNGLLPKDIRINDVLEVPSTFHARYSAKKKIYHYYLRLDPVEDPFHRLYQWHIRKEIDIKTLKQAAKEFIGTHNFASFANESYKGASAKNPIRSLYRLDLVRVR